MVVITKLFPTQKPQSENLPPEGNAITRLKTLHSEAEETARLANILGRSLYVGVALPIMAILTATLSVDANPAAQLVWFVLVGAVAVAVLVAYRHAMRQPFERPTLINFAKDLSAILLFAGFAWGAGAFLALSGETPIAVTQLFAFAPAAIIACLLRDRKALFLFLTPATALVVAASFVKPLTGGLWTATIVFAVAAITLGATALYEKLTGERSKPAMLSLP